MKITSKSGVKTGAAALVYIQQKDAQIKTTRSTTASVAEGKLNFPKDVEKWEIYVATYVGRDGNTREYPCVVCNDAKGEEHAIALTAFREKDPIIGLDNKTIECKNLTEFDADYQTIWNSLKENKDKITLNRVVGRRNNYKGRYEYFTIG